jgi:hypothetical protein
MRQTLQVSGRQAEQQWVRMQIVLGYLVQPGDEQECIQPPAALYLPGQHGC